MSDYKPGQKVLIKTSYRGESGHYILAGRPGVITGHGSYASDYKIEIQLPDGPYTIGMHQSRMPGTGFLLDTPENRKKYPVPDWNRIDLEEIHWPKLMEPAGLKVDPKVYNGAIDKIMKACGGVNVEGTGVRTDITNTYHSHNMSDRDAAFYAFPSKDRIKAVMELLWWIDWYSTQQYIAGAQKGHKLLVQLNDGELTMDDFNESLRNATSGSGVYHSDNPWEKEEEEEEEDEE